MFGGLAMTRIQLIKIFIATTFIFATANNRATDLYKRYYSPINNTLNLFVSNEIKYPKGFEQDICPTCGGRGKIVCPVCQGSGYSGYVNVHGQQGAYGCERCGGVRGNPFTGQPLGRKGTGYITCPTCGGTGHISVVKNESNENNQNADKQNALEEQHRIESEEQHLKDEEEQRHKLEEFEKSKQNTLKRMKGIITNELGLPVIENKELPENNGISKMTIRKNPDQLKNCDCEWGTDASLVDLRCLGLDPNKPITIDWGVVKGYERVIPAQIDPKTFENANYNKGFEALMHFDINSARSAVGYFEQALKERPNDPLVKNALGLAKDILKARIQKEETNKVHAADFTRQTYAALMNDEIGNARVYIAQANELDPGNISIHFLNSALTVIGPASFYATTVEEKAAYKLVGHSLVSVAKENYTAAESMLEVARQMVPKDPFVSKMLNIVHNYNAGYNSAHLK